MTRIRTRSAGRTYGSVALSFSGSQPTIRKGIAYERNLQITEDVNTNPGGNNYFNSVIRSSNPLVVNGTIGNYLSLRTFNRYNIGRTGVQHETGLSRSVPDLTAALQSRSHPGQPGVSIPVALAELAFLPKAIAGLPALIRARGNRILTERFRRGLKDGTIGADLNLTYQFGIRPLVNDVLAMMGFFSESQKRHKYLRKLRDNGTQSTRRNLHEATSKVVYRNQVLSSSYVFIRGDIEDTTVVKQWGTVKWHPGSKLLDPTTDLDKLSKSLFLGFDESQFTSNLWNALPWTWAIDYFSNIGDLIEGSNNSIAWSSSPSIMTNTVTTRRFTNIRHPEGVGVNRDAYEKLETKNRVPGYSFPFLTAGLSSNQLGLLGSVVATRGRR